jgi:DNA-binding transcriptional MerR regulator
MTERFAPDFATQSAGNDELLPIRDVVRLTGINPVTLRAWERRYGLIQPVRTEGGHRLYSHRDIDVIREAMRWTERGVAVSKVGEIIARNSTAPEQPAGEGTALEHEWQDWQRLLRQAVQQFDEARLEQLYGQIFSTYPLATVFESILLPLWQQLRLETGFGQRSQWLFLDNFLCARVSQRLQIGRAPGRAPVLLAPLGEQAHALELLVAGLLLGGEAGGVGVLPREQPFDELPLVCQAVQPRALALFVAAPPTSAQQRELRKLELAIDCPLALAGPGAGLLDDQLKGSAIANLGGSAALMRRRLEQFLAGRLDT